MYEEMLTQQDEDELQHHGILGQKWGIRRFQNKDGTRTPAGKKREQEGGETSSKKSKGSTGDIDKKKLAKGAAIALGVTAGAIALANPTTRKMLGKYGTTAITNLGTAVGTGAANFMNAAPGAASKISKKVASRTEKVGDAMLDAALASVGGIAISKVTQKLSVGEDASEAEKNRSKVLTDTATAAIKAATSPTGSSKSGNNGGSNLGKDVSDKVGEPSKKGIDKSSKEYNDLFTDEKGNQRDKDTKDKIRAMAKAGYDIDQIDKYLNHGEFEEWASQYMAVEIGR